MQVWDDSSHERLPFRIIAIASSPERVTSLIASAHANPDIGFGIMIRDPQHRPDVVRQLSIYALEQQIPENTVLISNSMMIPGMPIVHCTSEQTRAGVKPEGIRFGCSVHSLEESLQAVDLGATYLMFSPVFPVASKPLVQAVGVAALHEICTAIPIPVFALGGITADTVHECIRAGAFGVAGISMFDESVLGSTVLALRTMEFPV